MKTSLLFFICCVLCLWAKPQYVVRTVVPQKKVEEGAAFQVQYIVQQSDKFIELRTPDFGPQFRLISGPRIYPGTTLAGNTKTSIQNFTFTLMPLTEGQLLVKGATAVYKDAVIKSKDVEVTVLPKGASASHANRPAGPLISAGRLEEKINDFLFIKLDLDKKEAYVGQPVAATFTLYSRLESSSEVIKNPGFYGFSVVEMVPATEHQQSIEMYGGHLFNTHIIRKLQLYPLQPGLLQVDEMLLNNKVVYTDSITALPKKLELAVASEKAIIAVKPLPPHQPENFAGAVGRFRILSALVKNKIPLNKEGQLQVAVSGSGNFADLTAPPVSWPAGITGFDAKETERLQKDKVPVAGTKIYTYNFTADSTGSYTFAPIQFSYFDPQQKKYVTIATDALQLLVMPKEKTSFIDAVKKRNEGGGSWLLLFAGALAGIAITGLLFYKKKKKGGVKKMTSNLVAVPDYLQKLQAITEKGEEDKEAYQQLQQLVTEMLFAKYGLKNTGGGENMQQQLKGKGASEITVQQSAYILKQCEAVLYFGAMPSTSFAALKKAAEVIIRETRI